MSDESRKNPWQRIRGRLRENPPLHGRGGAAGPVILAVAVALTLALTACGGGGDTDTDTDLPTVAEVAPDLAGFGDLATVHSQPVSETFGPDGGELALADGSRVEVPEGAFPEPTELTVAIVDVEVEDPVGELRVYHLSTVEDVGPLDPPVVLEIPRPADEVVAAELVDGEWRVLEVPTGPTTKVEIVHFSAWDVAIWTCLLLVNLGEEGPATSPDDPRLFAFQICLWQAAGALGLEPSPTTTPNLSSADQAWVAYAADDTANELRRAGASNEDIVGGRGAERACLTNALERGDSRETALDACESAAAPYFPTATPTLTPAATQTSGAAPEPDPEPEPEPPPPTQGSLSILSSSATLDDCGQLWCFYDLQVTAQYVTPALPSSVGCISGLLSGDSEDVSQLSGTVTLTYVVIAKLGPGGSAIVECTLWQTSRILDEVQLEVTLPPP